MHEKKCSHEPHCVAKLLYSDLSYEDCPIRDTCNISASKQKEKEVDLKRIKDYAKFVVVAGCLI